MQCTETVEGIWPIGGSSKRYVAQARHVPSPIYLHLLLCSGAFSVPLKRIVVDLAIRLPFPLSAYWATTPLYWRHWSRDCWRVGVVDRLTHGPCAVLCRDVWTQSSRAPSVEDDEDGHLIYRTGDILQDRCSWIPHFVNT